MSSDSDFILSAKAIKKQTKMELGYDLSSNAFDLLNKNVKKKLDLGWSVEDLNKWLECIIKNSSMKNKALIRRIDLEEVINSIGIEREPVWRNVEISQLSMSSGKTKELEDEVERLKKIIQIILNKQAELI